MNKCDLPKENTNVEIFTRWQDPTIEELKRQLQQKENIIEKALYWLSENTHYTSLDAKELVLDNGINLEELLEILDKEVN